MIYIAGSITGNTDAEKQFGEATTFYRNGGYEVFNPMEFAKNNPRLDEYMLMINELKFIKSPACSGVVFLEGFRSSDGAMTEFFWAKKWKKPYVYQNYESSPIYRHDEEPYISKFRSIIYKVAEDAGYLPEKLFKTRQDDYIDFQLAAIVFLNNHLEFSVKEINQIILKRNHYTPIIALQKYEQFKSFPKFAAKIDKFIGKFMDEMTNPIFERLEIPKNVEKIKENDQLYENN